MKFTFLYASWHSATVTVHAKDEQQARLKAHDEMERRYEKRGAEPPVAWTFTLVRKGESK